MPSVTDLYVLLSAIIGGIACGRRRDRRAQCDFLTKAFDVIQLLFVGVRRGVGFTPPENIDGKTKFGFRGRGEGASGDGFTSRPVWPKPPGTQRRKERSI
jgi:hypothetical protein